MNASSSYIKLMEALRSQKDLWDLFTQKEEYNPFLLDMYDRFPFFGARHGNILRPFVSEFFQNQGLRVTYPEHRTFAVCLSHDIDNIHLSPFKIMYGVLQSLGKKEYQEAIQKLKALFGKAVRAWNPVLTFQGIMDLEKRYGAVSTFYVMAKDREFEGFLYDVADMKNELRSIVAQGWEVGLHGSRKAHVNVKEMKQEKKILEEALGGTVSGYRNHGLHFKTPDTWEHLIEAGFQYDATVGYFDMVGFRNGTCHPFYPFNIRTEKFLDILEIPLVIMDGVLFSYMRLTMDRAWEVTKLLIDTAERSNGVIGILWHNTAFDELFAPGWGPFYERILQYCKEKNAWMTTEGQVRRYYQDHVYI